ncbi:glutaredoxin family protein [Thalassobacillus pellis]|uniref:glutaredoxin family protein n=1 Tax=Thalassobacillus pellis TaxID=748008 RepID=UPI0019617ED5|nr:glutaredoxin family protein [Thalassobacillus pellis]MBM7554381.1 glutaredoxin [Thalassobacillus pellis]
MTKHGVIVYVSNDCRHCEQVVNQLKEWEVDFVEKNVTNNRESFKELQRERVYGTPATFIGGRKVLGFQKRKLKRELGIYENMDDGAISF